MKETRKADDCQAECWCPDAIKNYLMFLKLKNCSNTIRFMENATSYTWSETL